ncbi:MAG: hypothetical protein R3192_17080 [Woeseiaceae bacterium]|nr:hypothetical protein [Woeseiaceae bacterium]
MNTTVKALVLGVFTAVVIALSMLAIDLQTDMTPSDRVELGSDLPDRFYQLLLTEELIAQGEVIELFYSEGEQSVKEGGSILTNRRLIAYAQGPDGRIASWQIPNNDIAKIEMSRQGDAENLSVYRVGTADDAWIELWLPHEHGDGERFAAAVQAKIAN